MDSLEILGRGISGGALGCIYGVVAKVNPLMCSVAGAVSYLAHDVLSQLARSLFTTKENKAAAEVVTSMACCAAAIYACRHFKLIGDTITIAFSLTCLARQIDYINVVRGKKSII